MRPFRFFVWTLYGFHTTDINVLYKHTSLLTSLISIISSHDHITNTFHVCQILIFWVIHCKWQLRSRNFELFERWFFCTLRLQNNPTYNPCVNLKFSTSWYRTSWYKVFFIKNTIKSAAPTLWNSLVHPRPLGVYQLCFMVLVLQLLIWNCFACLGRPWPRPLIFRTPNQWYPSLTTIKINDPWPCSPSSGWKLVLGACDQDL